MVPSAIPKKRFVQSIRTENLGPVRRAPLFRHQQTGALHHDVDFAEPKLIYFKRRPTLSCNGRTPGDIAGLYGQDVHFVSQMFTTTIQDILGKQEGA